MYRYIVALALAASSFPYATAQIATQFQSPSVAFSNTAGCSNPGTSSSMIAGECTAIPTTILGTPSQSMNVTYPIDNHMATDSGFRLVTFYNDAICEVGGDAMPYTGADVCVEVSKYGSMKAKCSNILTGATYTAPANSS
ncbi:hypothetical protein PG993_000459 [Apiospora rasikravindrae]|uniref:Uncharacterized protein n=1 Tax=Apiospora rasikravindrae TaxID=990691 RepID=A0ABR1U8M1_9PEZI